jgi:hypothetical protein
MTRTALTALAAATAILAGAGGAQAGNGGISDPRGDANGTDRREQGVSGPDDVQSDPASLASTDVLAAELSRGGVVVHLASNDGSVPRLFEVTLATPGCATVTLTWATDADGTSLHGCHRAQALWLAPARIAGNDVVIPLPTRWPRWLPAGTAVGRLTVQTHGEVVVGAPGMGVGAVYIGGDYATGAVSTTLQ